MRSIIVLGLLPLAVVWARDAADIQKEYREIKAARADGWQQRDWDMAAEWAVAYLNAHDAATATSLNAWIALLDTDTTKMCSATNRIEFLESGVTPLARHVFLVTADYLDCDIYKAQHGTFFVVPQAGGKYRVTWRLRDSREPRLESWFSDGYSPSAQCVKSLPPTAGGHPRFWIEAPVVVRTGTGAEMSVWEWDGSQALLLANRKYGYVTEEDMHACRATFDGNLLRVGTKEALRCLFVTFPEPESAAEWRVRVTPQGVEDLGTRKLHPELDLIDELYFRTAHHQPATDLAAPEVLSKLAQKTDASSELMDWKLEGNRLCVLEMNAGHVFTLSRPAGKLFVTGVKDARGETCKEVLAK